MTTDNTEFDFEKALKGIQEGKPFTGEGGVLTSLIKNLAEAALEAELDSHLGQEVSNNRRNGKSKKTITEFRGQRNSGDEFRIQGTVYILGIQRNSVGIRNSGDSIYIN